MGAQFLYDLLHISKLLWGEEGVIQQPVIALTQIVVGLPQMDRVADDQQFIMRLLVALRFPDRSG